MTNEDQWLLAKHAYRIGFNDEAKPYVRKVDVLKQTKAKFTHDVDDQVCEAVKAEYALTETGAWVIYSEYLRLSLQESMLLASDAANQLTGVGKIIERLINGEQVKCSDGQVLLLQRKQRHNNEHQANKKDSSSS